MMKRKREGNRFTHVLAVTLAACLLLTPLSYAGVEIADMQFSFSTATFYDGDTGTFSFDEPIQNVGEVSILTTPTEGDYEYKIRNGSVTISPSAYDSVSGKFDGEITLTIDGTLTDAADATPIVSGTLIEATLVNAEWGFVSGAPVLLSELLAFETTDGLLFGSTNASGIYIDQFSMILAAVVDFSFDGFDADDATGLVRMQMNTDAVYIPEPATLALMAVGMGLLAKRRRNVQ